MLSCAVIVPDRTPLDFHTNVAIVVPLLETPMPDPVVAHLAMPKSIAGRRAALIPVISTSTSFLAFDRHPSMVPTLHGTIDLLRPSLIERRSRVSRRAEPSSDLSQPAAKQPD